MLSMRQRGNDNENRRANVVMDTRNMGWCGGTVRSGQVLVVVVVFGRFGSDNGLTQAKQGGFSGPPPHPAQRPRVRAP